jgi:hypothetical protein
MGTVQQEEAKKDLSEVLLDLDDIDIIEEDDDPTGEWPAVKVPEEFVHPDIHDQQKQP